MSHDVTYYAVIRLPDGNCERVTVQAETQVVARRLIEALYGPAGRIISGPDRVNLSRAV